MLKADLKGHYSLYLSLSAWSWALNNSMVIEEIEWYRCENWNVGRSWSFKQRRPVLTHICLDRCSRDQLTTAVLEYSVHGPSEIAIVHGPDGICKWLVRWCQHDINIASSIFCLPFSLLLASAPIAYPNCTIILPILVMPAASASTTHGCSCGCGCER